MDGVDEERKDAESLKQQAEKPSKKSTSKAMKQASTKAKAAGKARAKQVEKGNRQRDEAGRTPAVVVADADVAKPQLDADFRPFDEVDRSEVLVAPGAPKAKPNPKIPAPAMKKATTAGTKVAKAKAPKAGEEQNQNDETAEHFRRSTTRRERRLEELVHLLRRVFSEDDCLGRFQKYMSCAGGPEELQKNMECTRHNYARLQLAFYEKHEPEYGGTSDL
eukprot:g19481.t1